MISAFKKFLVPACYGLACAGFLVGESEAVEIEIDYSFDTAGFFDQAGSREALRAVCDYFETIITDDLDRIDVAEWPAGFTWAPTFFNPATGNRVSVLNRVIPRDTYVLYVGGRMNLGAAGQAGPGGFTSARGDRAFFDLLRSRGEAGALATPPTDVGSWGGSATFDLSRQWSFLLTTRGPNSQSNFVSIALHELAHVFGIGTAPAWTTHVSGNVFTGPRSAASFGRDVPLQSGGGHWQDDAACVFSTGHNPSNPLNVLSRTLEHFGVPAGREQIALMDPSLCNTGSFLRVLTELDVAGLEDMGWEIAIPRDPPAVELVRNPANGAVTLRWEALAVDTYQVQESISLDGWVDIGAAVAGVAGATSFTDSSPPTGLNFYRIAVNPVPFTPPVARSLASGGVAAGSGKIQAWPDQPPVHSGGCSVCGGH